MTTKLETAAAILRDRPEGGRAQTFLAWTEWRLSKGLPARTPEQAELMRSLRGIDNAEKRAEARRQAILVAEAKRRETRVAAEQKKMREQLARIDNENRQRKLDEAEKTLTPQNLEGYRLSDYEQRVFLAIRAK